MPSIKYPVAIFNRCEMCESKVGVPEVLSPNFMLGNRAEEELGDEFATDEAKKSAPGF